MAHMVPFFIYLAVMGVLFHQFDTVTKTALLKNGFPGVTGLFVHDLVLYLHFLVYTTASLIKIHGYQTRLKNHYSSIKQKRINWIIFLISGFMVIWISGSVNLVTGYLFHALVIPWPMIIFTIFIFANGIILTGLYSQDIFLAVPDKPVEKIKYEKNRIDQGSLQQILSAIGTLMKEKKPYLNPDFNLQVLSDRAGIKPHAISQAINTCLRKNFYDYINEFRIMESKRLLIHNVNGRGENGSAKKTVLEILYEAGFNSKSTFHRAFKKQTGTTPTYFLKSITKNTTSPSIS
ncbi:MAG: AraC family transcriptional regulator [Desulfobacteraceae bacterium]|nr:AraC family transcriptional regulator [Desulfobacteraceae bacterium]